MLQVAYEKYINIEVLKHLKTSCHAFYFFRQKLSVLSPWACEMNTMHDSRFKKNWTYLFRGFMCSTQKDPLLCSSHLCTRVRVAFTLHRHTHKDMFF